MGKLKKLSIEFGSITKDNIEQLRKLNSVCFPITYSDSFYKDMIQRGKENEDLCKYAYYQGFVIGSICSRIEPIPSPLQLEKNQEQQQQEGEESDRDSQPRKDGIFLPVDDTPSSTMKHPNKNHHMPQQQHSTQSSSHHSAVTSSSHPVKKRIYIMTLGVLAAYRGRGVGEQLVQSILDYCYQKNDPLRPPHASSTQQPQGSTKSTVGGGNPDLAHVEEIALHVHTSNEDAIRFYMSKFGFQKGELIRNYYTHRIEPPDCYLLYKKL